VSVKSKENKQMNNLQKRREAAEQIKDNVGRKSKG
jgi:hypothetical protein